LLPETMIEFSLRDSKRDTGVASIGAINLLENGVDAIIGAASSAPSMQVAKLMNTFNTAQISYSSTSAALSDSTVYQYFARTPPTDALQSKIMAQFIKYMGWNTAVTLSGDESYSAGGITDFRTNAIALGIDLRLGKQFVRGSTDASVYTQALQEIKAERVKLIVMFCQADDCIRVLKAAKELGMWGSDGYTWVMSETALASYGDLVMGLGGQAELDKALRGAFTQAPSNGKGSAVYDAFAARWAAMPDTSTNGPGGGCSEDTDSDG